MPAPVDAVEYYQLPEGNRRIRDMLASIRADEACHRDLNHHFADIPSWQDVENHEVIIQEDESKNHTTLKFAPKEIEETSQ